MEAYWLVLIAGFVGNVVVSGNEVSSTQPTGLGNKLTISMSIMLPHA
jgi:hypothetical protein